jgi:hypothetical protein
VIGDGNAVRVARQVGKNLLRAGKRPLGVDEPFAAAQRREVCIESRAIGEVLQIAKEAQLVGTMSGPQLLQEQPALEARQHAHRQKEALAARDPTIAARR